MTEITTTRANALIDPALHVWHGEIPLYLFLGGLVAGLMVLLGLAAWRRPHAPRSAALALLPWLAPVLLSLGMLFLWLDLENRWNVLRFYFVLRPASPMSWGAWILLLIYPAAVLFALAQLPPDVAETVAGRSRWLARLPRLAAWARARRGPLALLSAASGVALGIYTGVLLGALGARPLWNSAVLGPLFLVSGLSTGAAFMLLYRLADGERRLLGRADMLLIVVELALIGLWLIGLTTGSAAGREAAGLLLGGPYTAAFWTMVVVVGLLVPLAAEWLEHRHGLVPGRAAALLVLIGGFALRWIVVTAGQHAGWTSLIALP
jgi:formate-dependent nitrite reductase membrane component NrfD